MKVAHGLVIGKFYPPHGGHHLLVRTAAALSDRVTVLVMAAHTEDIGLEPRVAWMRDVHAPDANVTVAGVWDDVPVDYEDDAIWRAHVDLMVAGARTVTDLPVDAVFTSEAYGEELGRRLGCRHVLVDLARELVPVSGTAVRRDPVATWHHLEPAVRGGLARRVVVIGAESTGKTTLVGALVDRLRARGGAHGLTRGVEEYGRRYTVEALALARAGARLRGEPVPAMGALPWPTSAFEHIARTQNAHEDAAARAGGPVLVCDTDAFATGIWHERYAGHASPAVDAHGRRADLYLLTHPDDVPFVQDGLRDGEAIRRWMTDRFAERLDATGRAWRWLRGGREERVGAALEAVDALLAAQRVPVTTVPSTGS